MIGQTCGDIQAAGSDIEKVDDFCYLGSYTYHTMAAVKRTSQFVWGKQQQYLEK